MCQPSRHTEELQVILASQGRLLGEEKRPTPSRGNSDQPSFLMNGLPRGNQRMGTMSSVEEESKQKH